MAQKPSPDAVKGPERPPGMEPGGRPHDARGQVELDREMDRLRQKRDNARWSMVIGIGMLFGGAAIQIIPIVVGGVAMTVWGSVQTVAYSRRMTKLDDPWDDDEIDAWERDVIAENERERGRRP